MSRYTADMTARKTCSVLVTDVHRRVSCARRPPVARARARTFDKQLLTAVARGTLITSRYWPSRNMFTLGTLKGKASPGAFIASIVDPRRGRDRRCRDTGLTGAAADRRADVALAYSLARCLRPRRTLHPGSATARIWSAGPDSPRSTVHWLYIQKTSDES